MLHKPIKTIYFTINFITTDELTSYYQFSYSSVSKTDKTLSFTINTISHQQ